MIAWYFKFKIVIYWRAINTLATNVSVGPAGKFVTAAQPKLVVDAFVNVNVPEPDVS